MLNLSPPSARKLFTVTRYGRAGSTGTPLILMEAGATSPQAGPEASHAYSKPWETWRMRLKDWGAWSADFDVR